MNTATIKSALLAATVAVGSLAGLALPTAAQAQGYISVQIGPPPPPHHLPAVIPHTYTVLHVGTLLAAI